VTDHHDMPHVEELMAAPMTIVPTSELREGDVIRLEGCLMRCGPIQLSEVHPKDHGGCRYTMAKVIHRYGPNIPPGWFHTDDEDSRYWQVQGNDLARWALVFRP
jgi:hypothetical protein